MISEQLIKATVTLFIVMDPFGNIPVVLSSLKAIKNHNKRNWIIIRECAFAFLILMFFATCGQLVLDLFELSQPALLIAGAIILFIISLRMIFPNPSTEPEDPALTEPYIVPLAIPLLAGPSAIALVMLFPNQHDLSVFALSVIIAISTALTLVILLLASELQRILGPKGLIAIERLMGMLLITMSVQMCLTGLQLFFKP